MKQTRRIDFLRDQHEPTAACNDTHCYSCHVDEQGTGYIRCLECGHIYRTARELRRLYRRELIRLHRRRSPSPFDFPEPSTRQVIWMALTARASNITFCQHCIHDF